MANTALNRTVAALWTNKSGASGAYGDVVVLDNTNDRGFTTTTTAGLSTRGLGVIIEPNGIANNATGLVATCGWVPKVNLNTAATRGQFLKTHTVAGQATPHSDPQVEGDVGYALTASATPEAILFGSANAPAGSASVMARTKTLSFIIGNGTDVITTGVQGYFTSEFTGSITAARLAVADASFTSGSIVVDIWKDTFANRPPTVADTITASAKPTLSSATGSLDTTLTGWTTSVTAGDMFGINVDSVSSVKKVILTLTLVVS
jgi:hypothetical protein